MEETKWVGEKLRKLDTLGFKLWYTDKIELRNGVGVVQTIYLRENIFFGGGLNGHVGTTGFEGVHGGLYNSQIKKWEKNLITYKSGVTHSQIDFFMCKVIPREIDEPT
ncbi:hypothetical protein Lal_00009344 [Lupinus albus]|nr:hypothetical protein Lal_00009344 [Lupinus albus]